jgi:hypothetical protein
MCITFNHCNETQIHWYLQEISLFCLAYFIGPLVCVINLTELLRKKSWKILRFKYWSLLHFGTAAANMLICVLKLAAAISNTLRLHGPAHVLNFQFSRNMICLELVSPGNIFCQWFIDMRAGTGFQQHGHILKFNQSERWNKMIYQLLLIFDWYLQ